MVIFRQIFHVLSESARATEKKHKATWCFDTNQCEQFFLKKKKKSSNLQSKNVDVVTVWAHVLDSLCICACSVVLGGILSRLGYPRPPVH